MRIFRKRFVCLDLIRFYIYHTPFLPLMNKLFALIFWIAGILPGWGQSPIGSKEKIQAQVDSLKTTYRSDGFQLLRETSLIMESEYEIPIVLPLTQGSYYQFVFIGEPSSRLYEVRLFDWNEKQVVFQQKRWGDVDGNIIAYAYIPKLSEYHMMRSVQVNKQQKKDLTGYVLLFKKTAAPTASNLPK